MKLIEKKCPNCGAGLAFNESDKSVQCEYCKMNYEIKRDEKKEELVVDDIDLVEIKKVLTPFLTFFALSSIIPFIIFLIIFGMALFIILKVFFQIF